MNADLLKTVATKLGLQLYQVSNTVKLLFDEQCTVPFVARYRKEMTGSIDEVAIRNIREMFQELVEVETARHKYLKVVEEYCQKNPAFAGKFPELKAKFLKCETKQELEDLYLPFRPKRRTRAQVAREKGLEPLLDLILEERSKVSDLATIALAFVTAADAPEEKRVENTDVALSGAADIFAERVAETAEWRALVRDLSVKTGAIASQAIAPKTTEDGQPVPAESITGRTVKNMDKDAAAKIAKFQNYFEYREPVMQAASHRVMAVRRGEAEKILRVAIQVDEKLILQELTRAVLGHEATTDTVRQWLEATIQDSYGRLLAPSIETEIRLLLKNRAETDSMKVFSKNLEKLLLLPPIPGESVLGVDPGIRTGSKLAVVSATGVLIAHATIYPEFKPDQTIDSAKTRDAKKTLLALLTQHKPGYIAIGNGTASREIDRLIRETLKENSIENIKRLVVNESGASVYSTDEIAREEFPDLDPTIRSAVSIARRLQDPLAELVKIDPRSIGVGQYQHDVNVTKLKHALEDVVESCVNRVGVNVNTASYKLLSYVSGIGPSLAKNIVTHRSKNGPFAGRDEFLQVSGFGPKVFEQAAGFLRVPAGKNPLDNSSVHPERYPVVENAAASLQTTVSDLIGQNDMVSRIAWEKFVTDDLGLPTLHDIAAELVKPGRDPREDGIRLHYTDGVADIEDLRPGMVLQGTVTNVTNFGAFVDIGVHQDGLVHISELADRFVKDPAEVIGVGDVITVRVTEVDKLRRRISLSARQQQAKPSDEAPAPRPASPPPQHDRRPPPGARRDAAPQGGHRPPPHRQGPPPHHGQQRQNRPSKPEKQYTMDDLLSKFGKK